MVIHHILLQQAVNFLICDHHSQKHHAAHSANCAELMLLSIIAFVLSLVRVWPQGSNFPVSAHWRIPEHLGAFGEALW